VQRCNSVSWQIAVIRGTSSTDGADSRTPSPRSSKVSTAHHGAVEMVDSPRVCQVHCGLRFAAGGASLTKWGALVGEFDEVGVAGRGADPVRRSRARKPTIRRYPEVRRTMVRGLV